jgi:large subunit ribosomal protein L10Ae
MKTVTKRMGRVLVKSGKFPMPIREGDTVLTKLDDLRKTVKFQLKKVITLGTAIGRADMTEE